METELARGLAELSPDARILIATSGGVDSLVLTHLCAAWVKQHSRACRVLHVNHQLHPDASRWAEFVASVCRDLELDCEVLTADVDQTSERGLEAEARRARYDAMEGRMSAGDVLLTAHHADDQAETLILNLMRGSGVRGLGGMRPLNSFGPGWLCRPLLGVRRREILDWANEKRLSWIEDPDNANQGRRRNFVRHEVLPLLESQWEGASDLLTRSAFWCRDACDALDLALPEAHPPAPTCLSIDALGQHPESHQRWMIRRHAAALNLPPPPYTAVQRIIHELIPARADGEPKVAWRGAEARRYRTDLFLMETLRAVPNEPERRWDTANPMPLPGALGTLVLQGTVDDVPHLDLTIRWPQGGEKIKLPNRPRRLIKKLFQEHAVPPWVRRRTPLVFHDDELWSIGARFQSEACLAWMAAHRMALHWHGAPFPTHG